MSEPDLERRYRRLLAWYPWSQRRRYEDEMVAVLLAGARPGQRRPSLGESVNLVGSGLRARARAAVTGLANPAWVDAAAGFGLLAALVLLSQRVVRLLGPLAAEVGPPADLSQYLRAAGWAAVVIAVLVGLRRPAAALAWATVLGEAILVVQKYGADPVSAVNLLWPLALGVVAAAGLSLPAPRRRAYAVLGLPRLLAVVLGLGLVHLIRLVNRHQDQTGQVGDTWYVFYGLENRSEVVLYLWIAAVAVGALAVGLAVLSLPAALRWRMAALAAPMIALAVMVELALRGWTFSNGYQGHLALAQWLLLVAVPLTAFGVGAALVHRREQHARFAALGRAADRASSSS